jgi:hypothetical protein
MTTYNTILEAAVNLITDSDLLTLAEDDRESILSGYLKAAVSDFVHICRQDLTKTDDEAQAFEDDLDNEAIQILALGTASYWATSKTLDSRLFRNVMNTKDYTQFAPSTLLTSMRELAGALGRQYRQKIIRYSMLHGDIANARSGR